MQAGLMFMLLRLLQAGQTSEVATATHACLHGEGLNIGMGYEIVTCSKGGNSGPRITQWSCLGRPYTSCFFYYGIAQNGLQVVSYPSGTDVSMKILSATTG